MPTAELNGSNAATINGTTADSTIPGKPSHAKTLFQRGDSKGHSYEQDPRWTAVDNYTVSHLDTSTALQRSLAACIAHSLDKQLPDIAVYPTFGKFLQLQAKFCGARNILEVGTLGGYSTIWLASAGPDVRVTTLEVDAERAQVARENLEAAGLADRVEVIVGAGLEVLPEILQEVKDGKREEFGMTFIDANKEDNWGYFDYAVQMSPKGACLIVDNIVRKGSLIDTELAKEDIRVAGTRTVVENVGKDSRVEAVVLQTVGEKNYDGFLMALRK